MNPLLSHLQPYPFERLRALFADITPNPAFAPISLGIGEPKHATPEFIKTALSGALAGLASYPATLGEPKLREALVSWLQRRYRLSLNPANQVLPVNGSREALFALAQTVIDPTRRDAQGRGPVVVCPNPFYQIYEGAAVLAGAEPYYVPTDPARNFAVDWDSVPDDVWARTQLLFVCSPGNPTGAVMPLSEWQKLWALSDRHGFVIASDECYSEIYFRDEPPLGGLEAAAAPGPGRLQKSCGFHQPVQAQQRAGTAQRLCGRRRRADESLFALPHLPRQCHEPGGAKREYRCLERRGPRGGEPGLVPREVRYRYALAGRGHGSGLAGRWVLPLGQGTRQGVRRERHRFRPETCWLNTMSLCCPAVIWPVRVTLWVKPTATTQALAASAWPWWPKLPNVWKPPAASSSLFNPFPDSADSADFTVLIQPQP